MVRKEALLSLVRHGARGSQEALKKLLQEHPNELLERDFLGLIRCLGRRSAWQSSIQVFDSMTRAGHEPKELHYTAAMRSCAQGGAAAATALRLFGELPAPTAPAFTAAIASCGVAREWELAIDMLHAMARAQHQPDLLAFNAVLTVCRRAQKSKLALKLMEALRQQQLQPDVMTYSACVSACEEVARWMRAVTFLTEMRRDSVAPNVVTFSSAISACAKARLWDRALSVMAEMRESQVEPNMVTHSAVLSACEKAGQWQWALKHWLEMRNAGLRPNRMSYCAVMGSMGQCLYWQQDLRNYTMTLSALEKSKQWQWAVELLSNMSIRKLKPDLICRSIVKRARFAGSLGRKSRRKHLISRAGQKGTSLVSDSLEPLNILLLIGYYSWFFSTYLICWVSISILVIFNYICIYYNII
ncbi:unnamed protein product [Cladocopium goreaui]|uniref:Pentatricopeptide repeat-containing protein, chloroplastic n=1 Tax=Cladocopium goreaui TaxID=2562237 RepID=A0A9P1D0G1_9DINO|nr:unnamed protein product [Cladocopium goreaui]